jgi:hypothetical protein
MFQAVKLMKFKQALTRWLEMKEIVENAVPSAGWKMSTPISCSSDILKIKK